MKIISNIFLYIFSCVIYITTLILILLSIFYYILTQECTESYPFPLLVTNITVLKMFVLKSVDSRTEVC